MKTFIYKAKDGPDKVIEGKLVAESKQEIVDILMAKGYTATSIIEQGATVDQKRRYRWRSFFGIGLKDRFVFTRQLANLLRSGVPILRALDILAEQTHDKYFKSIIRELANKVRNGRPLSSCLQEYPRIFPAFYISMVKAGEESGSVDEALKNTAEYYRSQYELINKVRSALAYPLLILVVGLLTLIFMFTNVIPRIIPLFTNVSNSLPLPTQILIAISNFLRTYWKWILLSILILTVIFKRALMSRIFRHYMSALRLRLPLFGQLIFKAEFARFARALEMALRSGIPIIKAMHVSLPIVSEDILKETLAASKSELESGGSFGQILKKSGIFPPFVYNLVSIGEESGKINQSLADIAEYFEADCREYVKIMTTLLEPAMILIIGLVVGFIVSAILLPVFNLNFMQL